MGWKSTRQHAIHLMYERAVRASNQELEELLESVGYGDDNSLSLYGHNFTVLDSNDEVDKWNNI